LAALVALGICASAACEGGGTDVRQSSPQETAQGFKNATVDRDWSRVFAYLTRRAQEAMVAQAYLTGAYGVQTDLALAESFAALADKHGLSMNAKLKEDANLAQIYVELAVWIEDNLPEEHGGSIFAIMAEQMAATEFSDFEIDGDRARTEMVHPEGTKQLTLRRIEGRWYVD
jgi:hypothetical protein